MDILTKLNWVDVLIVIIMLRISYVAFKDGLSHEIFPLIGVICSITLSLRYYNKIASSISQNVLKMPIEILDLLAFITLAVSIGFIIKILKVIIDKVIKVTWHPFIEKVGGGIAGILRAAIVTSMVLIILALIPIPYLQWSIRDRSLSGMYFLKIGPTIYYKISKFLPTTRTDKAAAGREGDLVARLVSDKNISEGKVREKPAPEWDKASNF